MSLIGNQPLTRKESITLADLNQHLVGQTYATCTIRQVVPGPFDPVNRMIFLFYFRDSGDYEASIKFYHVPFFDVLLILEDENGLTNVCDLTSYQKFNLSDVETEEEVTQQRQLQLKQDANN